MTIPRDLCITHLSGNYELFGAPIRAKRTAHFSGQILNCLRPLANPKLFEALGPSFWDLVSKPVDGSKSSYKEVKGVMQRSRLSFPRLASSTFNIHPPQHDHSHHKKQDE